MEQDLSYSHQSVVFQIKLPNSAYRQHG